MPTAYCEAEDVRKALQKVELSGAIDTGLVEPAIHGASEWFARATNGHWYDSGGGGLITNSVASASNVRLDVPSSAHRTDRQLMTQHQGVKYPVSHSGPMAQILLPHLHVSTVNALDVRDHGGEYTDWVADSSFDSGRGNDYYVEAPGQDSYGRTYLYINTASLPGVIDYKNMIAIDYDYGLDWQTEMWSDVQRGIANLAAAEVLSEDSVITQIPESGTLVGVDTQHTNLTNAASKYLDPYISVVS